MKCLVVDDSATMRRIVVNALTCTGFNDVLEARNGREALQRCDATVALVITDWNRPGMGGLAFVRALRATPQHRSTPILMVTARSLKQDILEAIEAGVSGYILKPFTPQMLRQKIDQILSLASGAAGAARRRPTMDSAEPMTGDVIEGARHGAPGTGHHPGDGARA